MALEWKKVALAEDISAGVGGANTDVVGGGSANDILIAGASGAIGGVTLTNGEVLTQQNGTPISAAFAGDMTASLNGDGNLAVSLAADCVDAAEIKDNAIKLAAIAHASSGEFTGSDIRGGILYWKDAAADTDEDDTNGVQAGDGDGAPAVAVPTGTGQVLTATADALGNINPTWASPAGAGTITVNDGSSFDENVPLLMGSDTAIGDGPEAQKVYNDSSNLYYQPDVASGDFAHTNSSGASGTAALVSSGGFKGDLAGDASRSKFAINANVSDAQTYHIVGFTGHGTGSGYQAVAQDGFTYTYNASTADEASISGNLTITGNLTVQGDQTDLEVGTLSVEDNDITIANVPTFSTNAAVYSDGIQGNGSPGIYVFNGQGNGEIIDNDDDVAATEFTNVATQQARIVYKGHKGGSNFTNSKSVLGWAIAQETANGAAETNHQNALGTATEYGLGIMHVDTGLDLSTNTGNFDIAVGALAWDGSALYIQTGIPE